MVGIKVYLYYLVPYIGQKHFNALKNILYIKKSAVGQVIILNKSVIYWKKSLMTAILSLRHDQVISKTFNARSQNIKVLIIIKT